ncbi:MAG: glycosyltransferase [Synergistaceae bacterium]|nr:glycosyltransferase [Synergistaceae bacterium]
MKIAVYLNDGCHDGMDFSTPQLGNSGTGGTQYDTIMLIYALSKFSNVELKVYHMGTNKLQDGVKSWIVRDWDELIRLSKIHGNDILVFNADINSPLPEENGMKYIIWIHNYLSYDLIDAISANNAIKRVVFVGREHYDHYIDHDIIRKSAFIYNMLDGRPFRFREFPDKPAVTYTGGLYRGKGFHVLASMWKDIIREVPEARLYVVGSGKLYNKKAELGPLGVAAEDYEAEFSPYLMEGGRLLPSVKFCGNMGIEKTEIYYKTTVGVMNPSAETETLGMSAIGMEACGIPVVTRAANGLFDAVKHGRTGFLGRNYDEMKEYIILLLKDKALNLELGRQAKEFTEKTFLPELLVKQWLKLFDDVMNDRPCEFIRPTENFGNNSKRLKMMKHWLKEHHIPVIDSWRIKDFVRHKFPGLFLTLKKLLRRS